MTRKTAKTEKILDIAIELLRQEGDFGVTMRKVATLAEMSLSNVQYYFKNKDQLLKAVADRYFHQCLNDLNEQPAISNEEQLTEFVTMLLSHGHEVSDMCRIFREYWAISTRNDVIDEYLQNYYRAMAEGVSEILRPLAHDDVSLAQAVSVLIPFVEGYSVTARSLPSRLEVMVINIEKILLAQLQAAH